jgi:hypothetical protein
MLVLGCYFTHIVGSSESANADPLENGFCFVRNCSTQQANNIRRKQHALLFEGHQEFA